MKLLLIALILVVVIGLVAIASVKPDNDTVNMEASQPVINGFTETVKAFFTGLWNFGKQQMNAGLLVIAMVAGNNAFKPSKPCVYLGKATPKNNGVSTGYQPETTVLTQWETVNRIGNDPLQDVAQQIKQSGK